MLTCLDSHATHLELAYRLDIDLLLNAISQMLESHSVSENMISDNGSNFNGADKEFWELVDCLDRDKITLMTSHPFTQWHFNPPTCTTFLRHASDNDKGSQKSH